MKARGVLLPALVFLAGFILIFHPVLLSGLRLIPGDPGDARLNNYILEHGFLWLIRAPAHLEFWNMPFFFPEKNVTAYTDVLISSGPIYWVFRALGLQADTSFQLWLATVTAFNFVAMYAYLRRCIRLETSPAAFGAFLFAFASPRMAQINHPQLTPCFFPVLSLYGLHRLFEAGERKIPPQAWIAVFFGGLIAQLWCGFYLGWFFGLGIGVLALWALIFRDTRAPVLSLIRRHPLAIVTAAIVSAGALAPLGMHYLQVSREVGLRSLEHVNPMIPTLQSWFYLGADSWVYAWVGLLKPIRVLPMPHEHVMGLGLVAGSLAVLGLFRERRTPLYRLLLLATVSVFVMVTRVPGLKVTLWSYLFQVIPGAAAVRALARIALLTLFPLSIGAAVALVRMKRREVAAGLMVAAALEQGRTIPTYDKLIMRDDIGRITAQIAPKCAAFFYSPVLKPGSNHQVYKGHMDALWASAARQIPTINGYSGNQPPGWGLWSNQIRGAMDLDNIAHGLTYWTSARGLESLEICWVKAPEN